MINEFEAYEVMTTSAGNLSYSALPGKHDDIVSSMLLSHEALLQYSDTGADINFMEDMRNPEVKDAEGKTIGKDGKPKQLNPIEEFYRSIEDDDDD